VSSKSVIFGLAALSSLAPLCNAKADVPDPIRVADGTSVLVVHAQGAQVYECKPDARGQNLWQFREPIATLMAGGRTVGRHYAGPTWEMLGGDALTAKVVGRAPGATPADIPLLKLEVTSRRGMGRLAGVTIVQRINTKGGALEGPRSFPGTLASMPYAADYAFWRTR
jgi:hypothetical protein